MCYGLYVKFLGKVYVIKVICYMYYDVYLVMINEYCGYMNYVWYIYICIFIYD